jgi:valyl-tRNA synthetase
MGIIGGRAPAINRGYDHRKVEEARNFANKLWNIARYIEDVIGDEPGREGASPATAADHWILYKIRTSQEKIGKDLDQYRFSEAYDTLYHFVWDDLADWYIEASKAESNKALLAHVLEQVLLIVHPFAPFVTETIWQTLDWENGSILADRTLKKPLDYDQKKAREFDRIQAIVTEVRFITKALKVSGVTLYYTDMPFVEANAATIKRLARLQAVSQVQDGNGLYLTSAARQAWLDIDRATAQAYVKELNEKLMNQQASIKRLEDRLANKSYVKNAPEEVVSETKDQLKEAKETLVNIEAEKKQFS